MSNTTKRSAVALSAVFVLVMGAVLTVLLLATDQTRASGTPTTPDCTPTDAWTETIEHPAVTHEEIQIEVTVPDSTPDDAPLPETGA